VVHPAGVAVKSGPLAGTAVVEEEPRQRQVTYVQILEGAECIPEFSEQWDDLFARAEETSPYQSRTWVTTFIEQEQLKGTPLFVLAWHGTRLVALWALEVRKFLFLKIATPIGTGLPSYLGLLLDTRLPAVVEDVAEAFKTEKIVDLLCIEDLWTADDATNLFLSHLEKRHFLLRRVHRNPCPFIRLGCTYEEYMKNTKSAKSRQTLRRKERRLRQTHQVNIEHYDGNEITGEVLNRVAFIQQESWMKRRGAAVLGQPFYRRLLLAMAQAGLARVWLMTIDGADAAYVLAFVAHGRLYYAWTSFKLEYATSLSVGQLLTNRTIRDACRDGIVWYDFEHGDAAYKQFWSTDSHDVYRVALGRGVSGHILTIGYFSMWRLAKVNRLRSFCHQVKEVLRKLK
ncbi:MAG: GNAT family N-acetyltransferase, partial [Sedimentisphaerales bacterium]|jgi:CelD/BcsL family acetyltransferase involved in cellulose biosynthesis